jgi:phthalate 4,5-cis-dihydrodiol dehydrogenase
MLPTLTLHPLVKLVAATDPRADARERFARDFAARAYDNAAELCADPSVQAVYIASPHEHHADQVELAATHGKHVLVEKPMALTPDDCLRMIAACKRAGTRLLVGHSHSYDTPYLRTRELIQGGQFGAVRMVNAVNFTDFLYRPRRPEELDTRVGGGVVFSQAAHQVDVVRLLVGRPAVSVRAHTGRWDPKRPTEGAYNAQILFEGGAFASLTYSGYGRFDTDELNEWVGELGQMRDPSLYGTARAALRTAATSEQEAALKNRRAYGLAGTDAFQSRAAVEYNHFGFVLVSCDGADLRPAPRGIAIYADDERRVEPLPRPAVPRAEVIDELYDCIHRDVPPLHSGEWGLATLEICLAILQSAERAEEVRLAHQI